MIPDNNTNIVYISRKLKEKYPVIYQDFTNLMNELGIRWKELKFTGDIWARDYMPIQLSEHNFLKYRYWPDYIDKKEERHLITNCSRTCKEIGIEYQESDIIIDGGNVVPCGEYIVMTDKVFIENGKEKYDKNFTQQLEELFGQKIIFIPWHQIFKDEPFGHADGFIHWCGGNKVLMSNHFEADIDEASEIKRRLEEKGFEVTVMEYHVSRPRKTMNWAYVNYLQVGNKIIMPWLNATEDRQAREYIQQVNPDCEIYPLKMNEIIYEGGALHCMTWNCLFSDPSLKR